MSRTNDQKHHKNIQALIDSFKNMYFKIGV